MKTILALAAIATLTGGLYAHAQAPDTPNTTRITHYATDRTTTTTAAPEAPETPETPIAVQEALETPTLTFTPRCPNLIPAARAAGFPDTDLEHLDYLAWRESRCDIDHGTGQPRCAHNPDDPAGGSYGAWQINASWARSNKWNPHPAGYLGNLGILTSINDLCDWNTNAQAAKALHDYSAQRHGWEKRWWQWRL